MEISVTFTQQSETPILLKVAKKLAQGKFSVYQVYSPSYGTSYALKAFPKSSYGEKQYSKEMMISTLSHQNIIHYFPTECHHDKFHFMLTEFLQNGDFFDVVTKNLLTSEPLIRTYFHHLVAGVEYIHSQGVAHLDLKLENLMLGNDMKLRVIDFDQAQPFKDEKLTSGGTVGYRAPEVMNGICSDLAAVDLYAIGILLYIFMVNEYPFTELKDPKQKGIWYYSKFITQNRTFWSEKAMEKQDQNIFSRDFIELVNGLLECDVKKRFTIEDVKKSKWFNGPILSNEVLRIAIGC